MTEPGGTAGELDAERENVQTDELLAAAIADWLKSWTTQPYGDLALSAERVGAIVATRLGETFLNPSRSDEEDCDACFALNDQCMYHRGVADGIGWMSKKLARIAEDPEKLNGV